MRSCCTLRGSVGEREERVVQRRLAAVDVGGVDAGAVQRADDLDGR